ncbi:MAG: hypothetical protein KIT14_24240 [bacterium]|nr:hypothetical protein [bacterium]
MTRRLTVLAVAALGVMLSVQSASALTQETRTCIKNSRGALKTCRIDAIAACRQTFQTTFEGCFGPGAACATACSQEQAGCQSGPASVQVGCNDGCAGTFSAALDACRLKDTPEARLDCASQARLDQFTCRQACALTVQPALQACGNVFSNCLQACASKR